MEELTIEGRRIISIRAIPEVTGRQIPPIDLVQILAGKQSKWRPTVELQAYHLEPSGNYYPVPARDWEVTLLDLIKLEEVLRSDESIDYANHPEWRRQATEARLRFTCVAQPSPVGAAVSCLQRLPVPQAARPVAHNS